MAYDPQHADAKLAADFAQIHKDYTELRTCYDRLAIEKDKRIAELVAERDYFRSLLLAVPAKPVPESLLRPNAANWTNDPYFLVVHTPSSYRSGPLPD